METQLFFTVTQFEVMNTAHLKMFVLLNTRLLQLFGRLVPVNRFNHTSRMDVVTPTDRPKSVRNRCVIEVLVTFFCCELVVEFFVGIRAFVTGRNQISFFFSCKREYNETSNSCDHYTYNPPK